MMYWVRFSGRWRVRVLMVRLRFLLRLAINLNRPPMSYSLKAKSKRDCTWKNC